MIPLANESASARAGLRAYAEKARIYLGCYRDFGFEAWLDMMKQFPMQTYQSFVRKNGYETIREPDLWPELLKESWALGAVARNANDPEIATEYTKNRVETALEFIAEAGRI